MSIMDVNLMLRAVGAGALADSEATPASKDFGGPDQHALTYVCICPAAATGTTPAVTIEIQESDDDSSFRTALTFEPIAAADVPGKFFVTGKLDGRYRRHVATLFNEDNDFGLVLIAPVIGGLYEDF